MPIESDERSSWPLADDRPDNDVLVRRKILGELDLDFDENTIPPKSMGLALSGGGIRSATVSLGFIQALARHKRLLDFDFLSTVSGGGYLGSFLRSLYVPDHDRGAHSPGNGLPATPLTPKATQEFVESVLNCDARTDRIPDPSIPGKSIRNPIWWLREHGRYLAPNGPTDYTYAISYLIRNWIGLIYTFTIGAVAIFLALLCAQWLVLIHFPTAEVFLRFGAGGTALTDLYFRISEANSILVREYYPYVLSPLAIFPLIFFFLSVSSGVAYWTTVSLERGATWIGWIYRFYRRDPKLDFILQWALLLACTASAWWLLCLAENCSWHEVFKFWEHPWPWSIVSLGVDLTTAALVIAGAAFCITLARTTGAVFPNELRRRLTRFGAISNQCLMISGAIVLIDTLALAIVGDFFVWFGKHSLSGLLAALMPTTAWIIAKLPQRFAGGMLSKLLGEHVWTLALVSGLSLFGLIALSADVMVQAAIWPNSGALGAPWTLGEPYLTTLPFFPIGEMEKQSFLIVGLLTFSLVLATGAYAGFINLSSLHSLYSGRLTRAYLGASNLKRLREAVSFDPEVSPNAKPITENDEDDYIAVSTYQRTPSIAPIHLINVTLNETHSQSASQITDRDRKGVPVVFSPSGVCVDAGRPFGSPGSGFHSWAELDKCRTESLSVGQLCAISGAAFSAGMGMRTTLGGALAFTFANVRLGYWWSVKSLFSKVTKWRLKKDLGFVDRVQGNFYLSSIAARWALSVVYRYAFSTYRYLLSEMTALYTRGRHVYLSDGGHFENSGTYELLRRHVPVIVTLDNGADPNFDFEDLQNLVRKARIDLGVSVNVAEASVVQQVFGREGAKTFFNGGDRDWREVAKLPGGTSCALLLEVFQTSQTADRAEGYRKIHRRGRIVWVKPRMFEGLPPDVTGYGRSNPTFPQQTTSDQFFDEAQWESYRAVGFGLGETLLNGTAGGIDVFRELVRS